MTTNQNEALTECATCGAETDPLAMFPGGICLDCYRKTADAHRPLSSDDIVRMWGGATS